MKRRPIGFNILINIFICSLALGQQEIFVSHHIKIEYSRCNQEKKGKISNQSKNEIGDATRPDGAVPYNKMFTWWMSL
jgi:hypothetical protein